MDGMFMCAIHKQWAWGSPAFFNQVQDRQTPKWAGWLYKLFKTEHFLVKQLNNTAFSESYGHHTSVVAWADREHLVLFLERRRKPQPYTNSRKESWNSQRVFWGVASPSAAKGSRDKLLTLETLLMAGALQWWRLSHVTSWDNQNNLTTCVYTWGMCY